MSPQGKTVPRDKAPMGSQRLTLALHGGDSGEIQSRQWRCRSPQAAWGLESLEKQEEGSLNLAKTKRRDAKRVGC